MSFCASRTAAAGTLRTATKLIAAAWSLWMLGGRGHVCDSAEHAVVGAEADLGPRTRPQVYLGPLAYIW